MHNYLNTDELSMLADKAGQVFRESLEEAMELAVREEATLQELEVTTVRGMKRIGQRFLQILIEACRNQEPRRQMACRCGGQAVYQREREGTTITMMGQVRFVRAYYLCEACSEGTYPLDEQLGICAGGFSAALQEALAVVGVHIPFELASDVFERLTQVSISDNGVRGATEQIGQEKLEADAARVTATWEADSSGLPQGPAEVPRRLYGSIDETSVHTEEGWRKPKLGSWYRVAGPAPEQPPEEWELRGEAISYYGDIATAEEFGQLMYLTGLQRGADQAEELVFVADGAHWIWQLVEEHFPHAVQIVDWYHATEYIWAVAHGVYGEGSDLAQAWADKQMTELWHGKVEAVIAACEKHLNPARQKDPAQKAITYFRNNRHRMRYDRFRAQGYQIGSGTIESGCKRVIGARLKQAGMIWSVPGARQVIKARAMLLSGEWDAFCEQRPPLRRTYARAA